ncbi:MAG: helix-turn-helix transcriptional regulator [Sporomusaceae bacterium]|nr:helix-turn-helix transcriptional regulator [Sporomusaceae bacterium]
MEFHGERLRAVRESLNWSMTHTEKVTGVKQSTISELENGIIKYPREATVAKLCQGLKIKDKNFFYLDEVVLPADILPADTPEDLLKFIMSGDNLPWIALGKKIKDSGLPPEDLEQIIAILSRNKK